MAKKYKPTIADLIKLIPAYEKMGNDIKELAEENYKLKKELEDKQKTIDAYESINDFVVNITPITEKGALYPTENMCDVFVTNNTQAKIFFMRKELAEDFKKRITKNNKERRNE